MRLGAVWYVIVRHSQRSVLRRSRRGEVWRGEVVCSGIQLETGIEERNMEHVMKIIRTSYKKSR